MSGIINIVLKKNTTKGFNATINAGITHGINTRPTASINANYRTGKVNFFGNYNIDWGKYATKNQLKRISQNINQVFDFIDDSQEQLAKFGLDIYINEKHTLSFLYDSKIFSKSDFTTTATILENQNLIFNAPNLSQYNISESIYNVDYKIDIDKKGQNLEMELTYTKTKTPEKDTFRELINPNSKLNNYFNDITNNNTTWLANIDYVKPFNESTKLELGFETKIQLNDHKIITDQEVETNNTPSIQPRGNTDFTYDRKTYAAYINYNKDFGKFSLQSGLRFEQFNVDGRFFNSQENEVKLITDDIFSVYPSAYLTYFPSDNHEFQIGYSRRVDRPSIEQVSPIQEWTSPLTISVGNQNLTPQFSNSLEFNYTRILEKGYLTFGTFYRRISNQIGRSINTDTVNPNLQLISFTNYNTSDNYGFEVYTSFKPLNWWTLSPSLDLYAQDKSGVINSKNITINNTVFNSRVSSNFKNF